MMQSGRHFPAAEKATPRRRAWIRRTAWAAAAGAAGTAGLLVWVGESNGHLHAPRAIVHSRTVRSSSGGPVTSWVQPVSAAAATTTTTAPPRPAPFLLPDGTVLPVLVVFDGSTITLSGALPNASDLAELEALAAAYSKTPAKVVSQVVINPAVPSSVGVRVIEMNAVRFEEGSASITAANAPELHRVIELMKAMPNVTTLVIGHADQTGAAVQNLQLSLQRADAVVDYLVSQGVSPDRLSAKGLGEEDPLTNQASSVGLALNRRTEFVFNGLFLGLGH